MTLELHAYTAKFRNMYRSPVLRPLIDSYISPSVPERSGLLSLHERRVWATVTVITRNVGIMLCLASMHLVTTWTRATLEVLKGRRGEGDGRMDGMLLCAPLGDENYITLRLRAHLPTGV